MTQVIHRLKKLTLFMGFIILLGLQACSSETENDELVRNQFPVQTHQLLQP